ncbi:MAG TPA: hypothetical protein VF614_15685 [Chthoniobacteraceae bacterium]|jgi:hypothetical protein
MKTEAAQPCLRMPPRNPRTDGVFKPKGRKFYYARIWVEEKAYRRSTGALTRGGGEAALPAMRAHIARAKRSVPTTPSMQLPLSFPSSS